MLKLVSFPAEDVSGCLYSQVLRRDRPLVKEATAALHPDIQRHIDGLKSEPDCVYILVNALGAYEWYGANMNGDAFTEAELAPMQWENVPVTDMTTGYNSFYRAGIFRNHKNQDHSQSYGKVVKSVYNRVMHRVELIIRVDKALAAKFGHSDLYARLEKGDRIATSMGTRVPFDVCSICGHKSKTRKDYCDHARLQMGEILPDGRKVFVYNPGMKFFDLSMVVIGADRISHVMAKVASYSAQMMSSAEAAELAGYEEPEEHMQAMLKQAMARKQAEIEKDVPALSAALMPRITDDEPDLPRNVLQRLSGAPDLASALSAVTSTGIVLKPREFQRVILVRVGHGGMADSMDAAGQEFCPVHGEDRSIDLPVRPTGIGDILEMLRPMLAERSGFAQPLATRMTIIKLGSIAAPRSPQYVDSPLLAKISAAYNGYRNQVLEKVAELVATTTARDVRLYTAVQGDLLGDALGSSSSVKIAAPDAAHMALLGAVPLAYLYGAHRGSTQAMAGGAGQPDQSFVRKHPVIALSVLLGLARLGHRAYKSGQLKELLDRAAQHLRSEPEVAAGHVGHPHHPTIH